MKLGINANNTSTQEYIDQNNYWRQLPSRPRQRTRETDKTKNDKAGEIKRTTNSYGLPDLDESRAQANRWKLRFQRTDSQNPLFNGSCCNELLKAIIGQGNSSDHHEYNYSGSSDYSHMSTDLTNSMIAEQREAIRKAHTCD